MNDLTSDKEVWYRFDNNWMREFQVLSHTKCGVWIKVEYWDFFPSKPYTEKNLKKFVMSPAIKRWACPTKQEALDSFKARKEKQIKILEQKIQMIRDAINHCPSIKQLEEPESNVFKLF